MSRTTPARNHLRAAAPTIARVARTGALVGVLAASLMACAMQPLPGTAAPAGTSAVSDTGSPAGPIGDTDSRVAEPGMDACAKIPAADVTRLIGENDGGKLDSFGSIIGTSTDCTWTNDTTQGLVLVVIGLPGTAKGGVLPPVGADVAEFYAPLDDGMRQYGVDEVEFVAGDRLCNVRVSSDPLRPTTEKDRDDAVALAKAVRGRL